MAKCAINAFGWATDYPYMNFLLAAQSFNGETGYPAKINEKWYPTGTLTQALGGEIRSFPGIEYTGHWVLKFSGTGKFLLNTAAPGVTVHSGGSFVSGGTGTGLTITGTSPRVEFSFNGALSALSISFPIATYSGMSNAVLCRVEDEASVDAGDIFNPDCLDKYRELNPGLVRTLVWASPNGGNYSTDDAYAVPDDSFSYHLGVWHPDVWAGTVGGTDTYSCGAAADTPVAWTDGEIIQGIITNANTSTTVTLDVGGRGAKTVLDRFIAAPGVGAIPANIISTFVYDGVLDKVIWLAGPLPARVPLSAIIKMANALNVDVWWNQPVAYNDASVQRVAQYVKANLNSNLTFHIEPGNEVWNFGAGFPETRWFSARGVALGIPVDNDRSLHGAYAKRACEVVQIFRSVWGSTSSPQWKMVLAFQAFGSSFNIQLFRMNGQDLGTWGFDASPNRPRDLVDVYAYATYYSGSNATNFDTSWTVPRVTLVGGWADDYASDNPALMSAALDSVDTDIRSVAAGETLAGLNTNIYPTWNAIALNHGKSVRNYEGGLEINAPSTSRLTVLGIDTAYSAKINTLFDAFKHDARCYRLVTDQLNQVMAFSQSVSPMWFVVAGDGQWSALDGADIFSSAFKSWDALVDYNNRRPTGGISTDPFSPEDLANLRHHQDELKKATQRRSKNKREHEVRLRDAVEELYDRLSGIAPAAAAKVAAVIPAKAKVTETEARSDTDTDTPAIDWSKVTAAQIAKVIATMDAYAAQLEAEQRQQAIARADAARQRDEDDIETLLMAL